MATIIIENVKTDELRIIMKAFGKRKDKITVVDTVQTPQVKRERLQALIGIIHYLSTKRKYNKPIIKTSTIYKSARLKCMGLKWKTLQRDLIALEDLKVVKRNVQIGGKGGTTSSITVLDTTIKL